jgi:hypothetical protein
LVALACLGVWWVPSFLLHIALLLITECTPFSSGCSYRRVGRVLPKQQVPRVRKGEVPSVQAH